MRLLNTYHKNLVVLAVLIVLICLMAYCGKTTEKSLTTNTFRNLSDTARYVGMETCRQCHADIYNTYIETGMGQSFGLANKTKSAGDFSRNHTVYDHELNLYYSPRWIRDSLWLLEYRLEGKDTVHRRWEQINYIIGSGHHTNSHLTIRNGFVHQAPITFYTQEGKWDLPPGFEKGFNTRFNRLIGLECMSCHNAYPNFVKGSENRYRAVPQGIDCERCHGPGSIHVEEKQKGIIIDTSKYVDYSIVNPGKLAVDLQFELCQRCHLQGNAVLEEGKSFYDFKPGMHLHEVMSVFLPRYEKGEDAFIMASHSDRFKLSKCFTESAKHAEPNALRPYKNALTCVTCHNPHVSVRKLEGNYFNTVCHSCHDGSEVHKPLCSKGESKSSDCVSCHMPVSGSIDIPHVTIHDHYIRKNPGKFAENTEQGRFIGLASINNPRPSPLLRAKAYLQQYERFDPDKSFMLDSAWHYLQLAGQPNRPELLRNYVYYHFLRQDFVAIEKLAIELARMLSEMLLFDKIDLENKNAWLAYRFGEAFQQTGNLEKATAAFALARYISPYYPDFANKYAAALIAQNNIAVAENELRRLIRQHPGYAPAKANLGYVHMLKGDYAKALRLLDEAIAIQPDYEIALFNKAGVLIQLNQINEAKSLLASMKKRFPKNPKIDLALSSL